MSTVIGYHHQRTGNIKSTQIVSVSVDSPADAIQLGLFTKEDWESEMYNTIRKFQEFYPSEVALLCPTLPPHDNCVGPFYKALMTKGKIIRTGQYRRSTRSLRKGGVEWQYRKIAV